jgi:hypothetical protein
MKSRFGWFVVAGGVVGVLALGPWQGRSEAGTGPATIRITDREVLVTRVDVGARGKETGDTEIVSQQLFNLRVTSKAIGHSELVCTFVDSKRTRVCRGTYVLPRGKLVVGGSLEYRQFYDLAVLGGTGLYDNARGSVTVTRTHRRPVRDLIVVRLVG